MAEIQDLYARRVMLKYRLRPDEWDYTLPQITQLLNETPWTKVETPDVVRLKDEDGGDQVHVRAFNASDSLAPTLALVRGLGTTTSPTAIVDGSVLGLFGFGGQVSTTVDDTSVGAGLRAVAEGDWDSTNFAIGTPSQIGGDGVDSSWTNSAVRTIFPLNDEVYVQPDDQNVNLYIRDTGAGSWSQSATKPWSGPSVQFYSVVPGAGTTVYWGMVDGSSQEVFAYDTSDDTWTNPVSESDLTGAGAANNSQVQLAYNPNTAKLYIGGGPSSADVVEYDVGADSFDQIGCGSASCGGSATFPDRSGSEDADAVRCLLFDDDYTKLYAVIHFQLGTSSIPMVWEYDLGSPGWAAIGGDGVNSLNFTGNNLFSGPQGLAWAFDKLHWAHVDQDTVGNGGIFQFDGASTWTKIGGGGTGWTGEPWSMITAPDGSLLVGIISSAGDAELWQYDGADWTELHDFGSGYTIFWTIAVSPDGALYVGMGDQTGDGDVYQVGSFGAVDTPTAVELLVVLDGESDGTVSQKWYANQDVGIGGEDADGLFYDHSARRIGILDTSPARTLHVGGTEGMRLEPSSQPGSPAAGDAIVNTDENDWLEWYDGSAWRFPVSGPSSVTDGNLALWDGTTGRILKEGGLPASPFDYERRPVTAETANGQVIVFDSGGDVVTELRYIGS